MFIEMLIGKHAAKATLYFLLVFQSKTKKSISLLPSSLNMSRDTNAFFVLKKKITNLEMIRAMHTSFIQTKYLKVT